MTGIYLRRITAGSDGTRGFLYLNNGKKYPTIEPEPSRERGAIPAGRYEVGMSWSPRFRKILPEVLRVPGRSGIRIHGGCRKEHTQGCICIPLESVNDVYQYIRENTKCGAVVNLTIDDSYCRFDE